MWKTDDVNVIATKPLITPAQIKKELPTSEKANATVFEARKAVRKVLAGEDQRFIVVVGPCSIHDPKAAYEYAEKLNALRLELEDRLLIIMRTYFEKPRTTVGWKGLINDPDLDGTYDVSKGLHRAREILIGITEMGLATATELLEPIVPQYIADVLAWGSIGARTAESQRHREMASGLSMPIGFKNSTDGNLSVAINAMTSARQPHHFLGISQEGQTCIVQTQGNAWGHIILRGGGGRPNYDPVSVAEAEEQLQAANLPALIMVDCSHANCGKRFELQTHVMRDIIQQRLDGTAALIGVMLESNLKEGRQNTPQDLGQLEYGVSITDPCMGWEATESLLRHAHNRLAPLFSG